MEKTRSNGRLPQALPRTLAHRSHCILLQPSPAACSPDPLSPVSGKIGMNEVGVALGTVLCAFRMPFGMGVSLGTGTRRCGRQVLAMEHHSHTHLAPSRRRCGPRRSKPTPSTDAVGEGFA